MLNVAHFVSGGGTTMAHVADLANRGALGDIRSTLVVASKPGIGAIEKATKLGIPHVVVNPKNSTEIIQVLTYHNSNVILNNGWIPLTPLEVVQAYSQDGKEGYNQHPGALRSDHNDFGGNAPGRGMYGSRVTAAGLIYALSQGRNLGDDFSVESSIHRLTTVVDGGEVVGVNPLRITNELDGYQTRNGVLNPFKSVVLTDPLRALIADVQRKLLVLEHETVAQVLGEIGKGGIPHKHPLYDVHLRLDLAKLYWAKVEAARLFPKG